MKPQEPSCTCSVSGHFALFYCLVFVSFTTVLTLFISSRSASFKADIVVVIVFVPYCLVPTFHHSALPDSYRLCPCMQHTHTLSLSPFPFLFCTLTFPLGIVTHLGSPSPNLPYNLLFKTQQCGYGIAEHFITTILDYKSILT